MRILVVDDNIDTATTTAMLLEMYGHTVSVEYSGETALINARFAPPNALLLDIGLPGMDGFELARQIRAAPATANALLVAMTGFSRAQDRKKSLEAGFNHHLEKPVDIDKLLAVLKAPSEP